MADDTQQQQGDSSDDGQSASGGNTPPPGDAPGQQSGSGDRTFTQAEVNALIQQRLDQAKRTADAAAKKKADEDADAKLKEQGEWQKAAERHEARVKELEAEVAARDMAELRRRVALKNKLPEAMAARLTGTTEEELDADAKELAKHVKTEDRSPAPGNGPNPRPSGGQGQDAEAEYQKLRANPRYIGF